MKAITLKQPWATLVAEGLKKYEFRTWKYNYRGEIFIHAGAGVDKEAMKRYEHLKLDYPSKRIIAKVVIEDCIKLTPQISSEINMTNPLIYGEKIRDGYAWKLANIEKIYSNQIIPGKQGIWNYEKTVKN